MRSALWFIIGKSARLAVLLFTVSLLSFVLVSASPIDPVSAYIGADMLLIGSEQRAQIASYWGLDEPPAARFMHWASAVLGGDLGTSMIYRRPVWDVIQEKMLYSLALMGTAWLLSGVVGFAAGAAAAMNRGTWIDKIIRTYCYTLASTPLFWLGLVLMLIFSVTLGWFPIGLGVPAGVLEAEVSWQDRLYHMALPALTLSITGIAAIALHTREKLVQVLDSDYILFARAQGLTGVRLFWRHGLRNTLLPAVTLQFASLGELFGGAVLAEQVFSYPGLGQAAAEAGLRGDVPLLLGVVLFSAVFVFAGNTMADLLYRVIDPRMRKEASL